MWKRLMARVHPDAGGSDELFVWVTELREHVEEVEEENLRLSGSVRAPAMPVVGRAGVVVTWSTTPDGKADGKAER